MRRSHRKSTRKTFGSRKGRVAKRTSRSARSLLSNSRKNSLWKGLGLDDLTGSTSGESPKAVRRRPSKYSKYAVIPPSMAPFEENCSEREPLPTGYAFVPKGDVYITRHCRTKTKESQRTVYVVYNIAGKRTLGLRVPSDIFAEVLHTAAETADLRAHAVEARDRSDLSRSRQLLRDRFPLMPAETLETILGHAFLKGSGRVGRTTVKTDERKAALAVEAHIRHLHTPYEAFLDTGMTRQQAREAVWETVQTVKTTWEGGDRFMHSVSLPSR